MRLSRSFSQIAAACAIFLAFDASAMGASGSTIAPPPTDSGTILSVNDASRVDRKGESTVATFTVSLSAPAPAQGVSFDIATIDGTATAGSDYVQKALTGQTITAGKTTYSFDVEILGGSAIEPAETFFVNVTNVVGAGVSVGAGRGLGSISAVNSAPAPVQDIQNLSGPLPRVGSRQGVTGIVAAVASSGLEAKSPLPGMAPNNVTVERAVSPISPSSASGPRPSFTGPSMVPFATPRNASGPTPPTVSFDGFGASPYSNSVDLYGTVSDEGSDPPVSERGFVISPTDSDPALGQGDALTVTAGLGVPEMYGYGSGLIAETLYYVRGYATTTAGTGYSSSASFTTTSCTISIYAGDGLPLGRVGSEYSAQLSTKGGSEEPITFTFSGLPTGLNGSDSAEISGTPTEGGIFDVRVIATDKGGCKGDQTFTLKVAKPVAKGDVVISEFRLRGPNGSTDEFIELGNRTNGPVIVASEDESGGWSIAQSDGTPVAFIYDGTVIPKGGHWLAAPYCETCGVVADADLDVDDIPDDVGLALFTTANAKAYALENRLDAVGSAAEENDLYSDGIRLPILGNAEIKADVAWVRRTGANDGILVDNNNNKDFIFVATDAGVYGPDGEVRAVLGASAPEGSQYPVEVLQADLPAALLDPSQGPQQRPNREILGGSIEYRRTFTNPKGGGKTITDMGFKVIDLTTTGSRPTLAARQAELRVGQSTTRQFSFDGGETSVYAEQTYLAYDYLYPYGDYGREGGVNSILYLDLSGGRGGLREVSTAKGCCSIGGIASGDSISVNLRARIASPGYYLFAVLPLLATQVEGKGPPQVQRSPGARFIRDRRPVRRAPASAGK
ncbi:MAG: putative Ig domain-containing protein [Vicinamibacteria bacterium]